ncbi:uncharacterized protein LOC110452444 [Mizuhopecten yessoensis]|uniref:Methyltransferase KIAA1456 n=1 Tax=Mizuhopecten yessoensis TaxID=6573 RepID=A0A210QJU7_MIZYE|nr:uncharacterized protein LOC110452444 [Mizuhopecten yessoensis]XP_021356667.1 uncharacterized protein LOC110452444 [Mizuhopecten yessoensis]XP_021356668.1 uncharacterized protein LOC110452444 [Mizuhopecten yessoensis]OWF48956.1 methyltransferase KIAA1456 [Mizuhopecten yessoensis]
MPLQDNTGRRSSDKLEQNHVYSVYDQIAPCFSEISQKAWPNVRRFLKRLQPGSLVADIGCGSGRYLHINKSVFKVGLDICCPLVESAGTKGHEVLVADNLKLPFRSGLFDAVISIGVIHHFATTERRIEAVRELARILRPGGQLMLYVWAYEQRHRRFDGQDVLVPWHGGQKTSRSANIQGLLPFCSDKDLSSVSSISEDESSADTSDFSFSGRTLQRTASETFKDALKDTLKELDNVFWTDHSVSKVNATRKRSNTLPNILNGQGLLRLPEEKKRVSSVSRSVLAEECRRIEASMKALSASHNHRWYGGEDGDGEGSDITEKDDRRIPVLNGIHNASDKCGTHNTLIDGEGHAKHKQYYQNVLSHKSKNVSTKTKLAPTKTYLSSDSIVEPISAYQSHSHIAKNVKVKTVSKLALQDRETHSVVNKQGLISESSPNKVSGTSSKKDTKKTNIQNEEVSFFNLIKDKIKKVFDIEPPPKPLQSPDVISKSLAVENWLLHSFGGDGTLGNLSTSTSLDEFDGFAVREFPQSSRPSNRNSVDITDDLDRLQISGQEEVTNGVISVADDGLENCLSQSQVNGHSKNSESNLGTFRNHVNGCLSEETINTLTQSQTSGTMFVCSSRSENSVQSCADNQIRYSGPSSDAGSTNHNKSHDQKGWSHDCTINNGSCDQYGALESLCRLTDLDPAGNNSQLFVSKEFSNGEMSTEVPSHWSSQRSEIEKTNVSKSGVSKSLQNLNGYHNGSTESCQPNCVSDVQELPGQCAAKELCRYYHVFREGELTELITDHVHSLRVVSDMFDHSNWCVVVEKR